MEYQRPAPDPRKLLEQFEAWQHDEVTPGRAMADLKTGCFADLLERHGDVPVEVREAWDGWERGKVGPSVVLAALEAAGFEGLLTT